MFDFAYLDPSTGSLFIQALIGSIAGIGFVFRNTISRIVGRLASRRTADTTSSKE